MDLPNMVVIIVGIIVILIGLLAFFNPNFSRLINAPGSPRLKAIVALIVGFILLIIGFIIEIPS